MDQPAKQLVRQTLTRIGELAAHPAAFGILLVYASLWFVFDRASLDWHAFATLATWFMTLIIQRAEDRDTQALQAKLDELLRVTRSADSDLAKIDNLEPRTSNGSEMRPDRRWPPEKTLLYRPPHQPRRNRDQVREVA